MLIKFNYPYKWYHANVLKSIAEEVSLEWSHHRILSTGEKVRTILQVLPQLTLRVKGLGRGVATAVGALLELEGVDA